MKKVRCKSIFKGENSSAADIFLIFNVDLGVAWSHHTVTRPIQHTECNIWKASVVCGFVDICFILLISSESSMENGKEDEKQSA